MDDTLHAGRLVEIARAIVRKPRIILMDEGVGIQGLIANYSMDVIAKITHRVSPSDRSMIRFSGLPAEVKVNAGVLHGTYLAGKFD